jgi:hypothetical protein
MQKTIYAPETIQEIIQRIDKLKPTDTPFWGQMNAVEMLTHCNMAHQSILKAPPSDEKSTLKQLVSKFIFFRIKNEFPRFARGPKRFDMKGKVNAEAFEEEKSKYKHIIGKYGKVEGKIAAMHPRLGRLSHAEWGRFVWMHADHHLRQFGL